MKGGSIYLLKTMMNMKKKKKKNKQSWQFHENDSNGIKEEMIVMMNAKRHLIRLSKRVCWWGMRIHFWWLSDQILCLRI